MVVTLFVQLLTEEHKYNSQIDFDHIQPPLRLLKSVPISASERVFWIRIYPLHSMVRMHVRKSDGETILNLYVIVGVVPMMIEVVGFGTRKGSGNARLFKAISECHYSPSTE